MRKLLLLVILAIAVPALADDENINVTAGPWRTHPCFQYNNYWYGELVGPVSATAKWFWGYEEPSFTYPTGTSTGVTDPVYGPVAACRSAGQGRGFVYGLVNSLEDSSSLSVSEYKALVKELPNDENLVANGTAPLYWDPTDADVLYGNFNDGTIKKIDLTPPSGDPAWSTICTWGKNAAGNPYTTIYGWGKTTGDLVGIFGAYMWQTPPDGVAANDAVSCNVTTGAVTDIPIYSLASFVSVTGVPSYANSYAYIDGQSMGTHGHISPAYGNAAKMSTVYGYGIASSGVRTATTFTPDTYNWGNNVSIGHTNWLNDAQWFVGDIIEPSSSAPHISSKAGIVQRFYDQTSGAFGEARLVLTHPSAGFWYTEAWDDVSWQALLMPSMNGDGSAIAYTATNGKYSHDDYVSSLYDSDYSDYEPVSMWVVKTTVGPPDNVITPTVDTEKATITSAGSIDTGIVILSDGSGTISACGIEYDTDAEFGSSTTEAGSCGDGEGTYDIDISGLAPCTVYYYRATATNVTATANGISYSVKTGGACVSDNWTQSSSTNTIELVASEYAVGLESATTSGVDTTGATLLVVAVASASSGSDPTVTDSKNNKYTQLTETTNEDAAMIMFYMANPTVGANHTFTCGTGYAMTCMAMAFSGVVATSPFDKEAGKAAASTTVTFDSITPAANNELLVTALAFDTAGSPVTIDSSFTETEEVDYSAGSNYGGSIAYKVQTTANAETPKWTRTNSENMAARIALFKAGTTSQNYWYMTTGVKPHTVKSGSSALVEETESCPGGLSAGEWCHDGSKLYVQVEGGGNPGTLTIQCTAVGKSPWSIMGMF